MEKDEKLVSLVRKVDILLKESELKNKKLYDVLKGFLDYYDPKGGMSEVPLGPFERAIKLMKTMGNKNDKKTV